MSGGHSTHCTCPPLPLLGAPRHAAPRTLQKAACGNVPSLCYNRSPPAMSRTLTKHDDPGMVEVRREDQMNINKFSALNRKLQEIAAIPKSLRDDMVARFPANMVAGEWFATNTMAPSQSLLIRLEGSV